MKEALSNLRLIGDFQIFSLGGNPITPAALGTVVVILVIAWIASRVIRRTIEAAFQRRGIAKAGTVVVISRLTHYVILFSALGVALDTLGVDLGALFAASAVFAIGIGFAMQTIAQNFVAGIILLVERTITPGDVIEVEGQFARVRSMGIRSTVVQTPNDEELIVPNSILVGSTVRNYTLTDSVFRVRSQVGVAYGSDLKIVFETLLHAAEGMAERLPDRNPVVQLVEFGTSSVDFDVSIWVADPWERFNVRSRLNDAVWWALKRASVTIAFPQMDLHLDAPVMDALAAQGPGQGQERS